jgi:hypothetical protein
MTPNNALERTREELSAKLRCRRARRSTQPLDAMKISALVVASIIHAAAAVAHTPGAWILVSGGTWTPAETTMKQASTGLRAYAETAAKQEGLELRPWSEYSFQYQGRVSKGQRYIYILGLCATVGEADLHSRFYEVLDGGACFFSLTFDPTRRRYQNFRINAVR